MRSACNSNPEPEVLTAEQEAAAAEAPVVEMTWDESTRQFRDERGEIVTKHNSRISGHRNAQKLVDMTVRGLRCPYHNLLASLEFYRIEIAGHEQQALLVPTHCAVHSHSL